MNCIFCKSELSQDSKFCPNCGKAVPIADTSAIQDIQAFIDGRIKAQTTFLSARDFLQGAKPLRFRWIITIIGAIISIPVFCLGAIPAFIISTFICGGKHLKLNAKKYTLPCDVDIQELGEFLRRNLTPLAFSEWQVGIPSAFGLRDDSTAVIQCVFENKTVHRIVFQEDKDTYKIIVQGATTKNHMIRGGTLASAGLMFKNEYRVQPILAAAVEYYFQQQKEV